MAANAFSTYLVSIEAMNMLCRHFMIEAGRQIEENFSIRSAVAILLAVKKAMTIVNEAVCVCYVVE